VQQISPSLPSPRNLCIALRCVILVLFYLWVPRTYRYSPLPDLVLS
jgi:hypothetical protein